MPEQRRHRLVIGTASWADKPLIESGRFYPPGATTPEARLRYYASLFPLVEADSTYYGLPTADMTRAWVDRTPAGFTFDVKAFSLFTEHPAAVQRLPKEIRVSLPEDLAESRNLYRKDTPDDVVDACWRNFVDALIPLHEAGKLGVVVFQFPKWVFPNRRTKRYLEELKHRLGPFRGAVEFRNDVWMGAAEIESTAALLGELDFTYICVDEPQGSRSSVPPVAIATNETGFVRFHGRNRETWEKRVGSSAERFDYRYTWEELEEWLPKIRQLAAETHETHLVMNTNSADQGPANARLLAELLESTGLAVVKPAGEPGA